jgi:site-specific DNA recombinase
LSKVKRGMAPLVEAYQDGLLDREQFEPRLKQARERLAKLTEQARVQADEQAQQKELQLVIGRLQEFGERVRDGLQAADGSQRREITRALVKQVEVDRKEVRIVYRISSPPFGPAPERGLCRIG